jgi:hypothetical protein
MSDVSSQQEQELDLWLAYQHHRLVIDVMSTLEVEAGLREVLIPTHHADLVTDLARCLDVEAGLASIVPTDADVTPSTEPLTPNWQPADPEPVTATSPDHVNPDHVNPDHVNPDHVNPDHVNVEHAEPDTVLLKFLHAAASWTPSTRLAMRAHPVFAITGFHDRAQTLVQSLGSASDLANGLDHKLEHVLNRILDRVPDLPPDLDRALDRDLDRTLDPARDLGSYLDRALARTRALARNLGSELTRTRTRNRFPALDLDYTLDHVLNLDYALDRDLTQASNYAYLGIHDLAHYRVRVRALVRELDRVQSFADELVRTIRALVHFHCVLSDVTGVDLRSIDLTGIPLQGLRWSVQTQWPPEIKDQIWRDSVQITEVIFEVGHGGTTYVLTNI